ncbi:MAG: hypothetical protein ACOCXT_02405 [Candidatus Dojkabacteria bacterium]
MRDFFAPYIGASESGSEVSIVPALVQRSGTSQEPVKADFKLTYKNMTKLKVAYKYYESNAELTEFTESELFSTSADVNAAILVDAVRFDMNIDTSGMVDKTYFLLWKIILNGKQTNTNIQSTVSVSVPFRITINDSGSNPLPIVNIKPEKKLYIFDQSIEVTTQAFNDSEKIINYGAEIIAHRGDSDSSIMARNITNQQGMLLPKEGLDENVIVRDLPNTLGFLPYTGKVDLFVRGTANNERHFHTATVSVWIIPYQSILVLLVAGIIFAALLTRSAKHFRFNSGNVVKKNKTKL